MPTPLSSPVSSLVATSSQVGQVGVGLWILALTPVALLLALVLWGRFTTLWNALITVAVALLLGGLVFGADLSTLAVGTAKGAWVGVWILYVIWPALFMHHLASRIGMQSLGRVLSGILPTETGNILLLAWVLPSFIQGVSGFGVPIAVAAPLLVAMGVDKARAVALPLIGYHWAVGFGSMGSSFYMAALTGQLDPAGTHALAVDTSILLGIDAFMSGVGVAIMYAGLRGIREGWPMLITVGPAMALTQAFFVRIEPGIGSLSAGAVALGLVFLLKSLWWRLHHGPEGEKPEEHAPEDLRSARNAAVPYVMLALVALVITLPPAVRAWSKGNLRFGPSLPATAGGAAGPNEAVDLYNPINFLSHPGSFLLVACAISLLVWQATRDWPRGALGPVVKAALRQAIKSSPSVLLLASVAGILVDTGMTSVIARGTADVAGHAYVFAVPAIGALGSFITGSTTSSNALFSSLQVQVAHLVGYSPPTLLSGQLAGGNIGNSLAPVVALLGVTAVGGGVTVGQIVRRTLPVALVLLAVTTTGTVLMVF